MRKILTAFILCVFSCGVCNAADVNPDTEIHKVIGGLYSLVSALAVNGEADHDIRTLRKYFADIPGGWLEGVKAVRVNNELWAGVSVGKYSTARKYLRANSQRLGITDTPAGSSWLGEDFAWVKAGVIHGGRLTASSLKASQADGAVFFSVDGNEWWQSYPDFTRKAAQEVMSRWGVKVSGLHKPEGVSDRVSIYDQVRPSEVRKPGEMHSNRKHEFGESYDIDVGDVIFKPIPNTHYDSGNM